MLMRIAAILLLLPPAFAWAGDGNRLSYLDRQCDPYYVGRDFPKLTTPQWVGEQGVEAVVVLAIDDMRDTAKYENYLRPILNRLKQVDGRAPVSIMTCRVDPQDPQLQRWLEEGLSIEVHTVDHPCPLLKDGDFAKAKSTYDRCVDLMGQIPGNQPVAFRTPCCDSLNTVSPRFFTQVFGRETENRNRLAIDSSVFQVFTPDDPELPRELVRDQDGERFRKYIPFPSFVNWITDYPYPYVIAGNCWEFPCMVPSDWEAQHLQKPFNPRTVEDMQAALDATVVKQGVFNLVFHPHGWIRAEQVVELIDHAVSKHGKKVKFLTFAEAHERLKQHLLDGFTLRQPPPSIAHTVQLADINGDGYQDVLYTDEGIVTKVWQPKSRTWLVQRIEEQPAALRMLADAGRPAELFYFTRTDELPLGPWSAAWSEEGWAAEPLVASPKAAALLHPDKFKALRFRDLDDDGRADMLLQIADKTHVLARGESGRWDLSEFSLPDDIQLVRDNLGDAGLRLVDVNGDGFDDCLFSNQQRYSLHLFQKQPLGWKQVVAVKRDQQGEGKAIPPFIRPDGTNNGVWFHSGHIWLQNEDTARQPNLVDRMSFADLLTLGKGNAKLAPQPGPLAPEESRDAIAVAEGLEVQLVAAEPLVADPVAFDWGLDGRLWVVEMPDYPNGMQWNGPGQQKGDAGGRVKVLTDEDGDGVFDKSQLFLDKVPFPTAIKVWRGGVLIAAAPEVIYAEDRDGDGRAEVRETLYSGFVEGNQQHRVNGLRWGLDNWLHLANGDSGGKVRSTKRPEAATDIGGRDLRIRPGTGELRTLSGKTQFGRCRDDWGNWFGGNNSNPLWHYALEEPYLNRNPHVTTPSPRRDVPELPGAAPVYPRSKTMPRFNDFNKANRFTSACSPAFYRDLLLGPKLAGDVFICEPVHNLVSRQVVSRDGIYFSSRRAAEEQKSEFLASTDNWFRPVMVRTGPDGALWIADMYRYVIEHPEWIPPDTQRTLDMRAGDDRGRIYRVVPKGRRPALPASNDPTTEQLVELLGSTNGWLRDAAQERLVAAADPAAAAPLRELVVAGKRPATRLQALCTLAGLDQLTPETLVAAAGDAHYAVRCWAVRLSEPLAKDAQLASRLRPLIAHERDPRVVLQALYSLGSWAAGAENTTLLGELAMLHSRDEIMRTAAISSIHAGNAQQLLLIWLAGAGGASSDGASRLVDGALATLVGLGQKDKMKHVMAALAASDDVPELRKLELAAEFLQALSQRNEPWDAGVFAEATARARELADGDEEPPAGAVRLLGLASKSEHDAQRLAKLLAPQRSPQTHSRAAAALGQMGTDAAVAALLRGWSSHSPAVRSQILDLLGQRAAWTKLLLQAVDDSAVPAAQVDARRRALLLEHANDAIRRRAAEVFAGAINSDRKQIVEDYRQRLPAQTDVASGRQLFTKTCANCHRLGRLGHAVGPDLTALRDRSPQAMLVAVLDPNRAVEDKFADYAVATEDGRRFSGLLIDETGAAVTLLGAEAKQQRILRSRIARLQATGKSLMPEGLEKDMQPQDLADLIAFIRSHGEAPKPFPGNQPQVVTADDAEVLALPAAKASIYGPSIVFEPKYKNLGFWSSPEDRAEWSLVVRKAGRYRVTLDYAIDKSAAGGRLQLLIAGQKLMTLVQGDKTWDDYLLKEIGTVDLPAGVNYLTARSEGPLRSALIDLRAIRLTPVDGAPK